MRQKGLDWVAGSTDSPYMPALRQLLPVEQPAIKQCQFPLPPCPPMPPQISCPSCRPGPSLEFVRGPIEIPLFETWQLICISPAQRSLAAQHTVAHWLVRFLRTRTKCPSSPARSDRTPRNRTGHGDDRAYTQALTHALRSYLTTSRQGPIRSAQTSTETLRNLPADLPINDSELKSFLEQCDTVKFANGSPDRRTT